MLHAITSANSVECRVPLGVAVTRLSSHQEPCELPRVIWLPADSDATVLVFSPQPAALTEFGAAIEHAHKHLEAHANKSTPQATLRASPHLEELTAPSLLASATAALALAGSSAEQLLSLTGVSPSLEQLATLCEPLSGWWREAGNVYAVELATWRAVT